LHFSLFYRLNSTRIGEKRWQIQYSVYSFVRSTTKLDYISNGAHLIIYVEPYCRVTHSTKSQRPKAARLPQDKRKIWTVLSDFSSR